VGPDVITLTPIVWTVRTGPAHEGYGDPYEGVATVQRCGDVAHVSAACGKLPIADWRELDRTLREMGFAAIVFERVKDGSVCHCRRDLQRKPGANLTGARER
jgi:hypothetical protein